MKRRIVLIGGGFVGTYATHLLANANLKETEIILVSQTDHFLFAPLLIEALAGDISIKTCSEPLPPWADRVGARFIQGRVQEVNRNTKILSYTDSKSGLNETLHYDDLVFAQGGSANFFRTVGAKEHAFPLKSATDLAKIEARLEELVKQAHEASTEGEKRALLTVGVAGGGPAGIESICSLRTRLRRLCKAQDASLIPFLSFFVIESSPDILPGFPDALRTAAKAELTRQGISLYTGEAVTEVKETQVLTPARTLQAAVLLWTAGIAPNLIPVTPPFDAASPTGLPILKNTLELDEHHFIAGDIVALEWNEKKVPKNGQIAMQLAAEVSHKLIARERGQNFSYRVPETKGFFLGMGEIGFLAVGSRVFKSKLINLFRQWFYRFRFRQII
jgi:NADH dehydrogenase